MEDEAFAYDWAQRFGPSVAPPRAGNTWLALNTPSLITLTAVPRLASSSPAFQGKGLFDAFFPDAPWRKRWVSAPPGAGRQCASLLFDFSSYPQDYLPTTIN